MGEERKIFLKGLLVGIVILIWGYTVTNGAIALQRRNQELTVTEKIDIIYSILERSFVGELDRGRIEDAMFSGMLYGVGDRYTSYMTAEEFARFMELSSGAYEGIGAVVSRDDDGSVLVVSPYVGSPAYLAGILPGDRIISVDGYDIRHQDLALTISMIRGPAGTSVELTIYREIESETFIVDIVRGLIEIPTVAHEMLETNIGYIKMSGFEVPTYDQFVNALDELNDMGMEALIIDLRNNPGGRMDSVVRVTDRLVPEGIIVYTEDGSGNRRYMRSSRGHIGIPLVLLINGNSASASEILAGAVQDHQVGVLVGQQSFGKGSVQDIFPLPDGSAIRVTIATYYTPLGNSIHEKGLTPDYVVPMDAALSARITQLTLEEDVQLQRAIEIALDMLSP